MTCWYCSGEIPNESEICPHCNAPQALEGCCFTGEDIKVKSQSGEVMKIIG